MLNKKIHKFLLKKHNNPLLLFIVIGTAAIMTFMIIFAAIMKSNDATNTISLATYNPTSSEPVIAQTACDTSAYDTTVLSDNPIAYWQLNDSGTNTLDCSSAQTHTGTYNNAPQNTILPNGDTGKAFDGTTQYAEIPDADDLSVTKTGILTLEAWIRPDVLEFPHQESTGYIHWMGKGVTGQHEYASRMYSYTNSENRPNRISGYAFNPSGGIGVGSYFQDPVNVDQWIHYVLIINTSNTNATYPTGYTKIYKNGILRDQDSLSSLSIVPGNGTAPFRIATRDFASFFQGAIGKVAVYNYELPSNNILSHYQTMTVTPSPTPTAIPTPSPSIIYSGNGLVATQKITRNWDKGYCADISIKNTTSKKIIWSINFTIKGRINSLWNAKWSQTGSTVYASGQNWNKTIGVGQTLQDVGYCTNY